MYFCVNPRNELCSVMSVLKEFAASVQNRQMCLGAAKTVHGEWWEGQGCVGKGQFLLSLPLM